MINLKDYMKQLRENTPKNKKRYDLKNNFIYIAVSQDREESDIPLYAKLLSPYESIDVTNYDIYAASIVKVPNPNSIVTLKVFSPLINNFAKITREELVTFFNSILETATAEDIEAANNLPIKLMYIPREKSLLINPNILISYREESPEFTLIFNVPYEGILCLCRKR